MKTGKSNVERLIRQADRNDRRRARYAERRDHVLTQQRERYAANERYRTRKQEREAGYQADIEGHRERLARRRALYRWTPLATARRNWRITILNSLRAVDAICAEQARRTALAMPAIWAAEAEHARRMQADRDAARAERKRRRALAAYHRRLERVELQYEGRWR